MHSNGTVIYFDPLSADQPASAANDTPAADNTSGDTVNDTTTSTGTTTGTTDATQPSTAGSIISLLLPLVLMGVVFYFFLIRPQRKKDKAVKNMLDSLKNGDRVCTIGGIYGTITNIRDENTITLAVGPQDVPVVFARWAIRNVEEITVENDTEVLA